MRDNSSVPLMPTMESFESKTHFFRTGPQRQKDGEGKACLTIIPVPTLRSPRVGPLHGIPEAERPDDSQSPARAPRALPAQDRHERRRHRRYRVPGALRILRGWGRPTLCTEWRTRRHSPVWHHVPRLNNMTRKASVNRVKGNEEMKLGTLASAHRHHVGAASDQTINRQEPDGERKLCLGLNRY